MVISPKSILPLARFLTGDIDQTPYLSGPKLIDLFNQYGFDDKYGEKFPSRWLYVEEKLKDINNTDHLRGVLEELIDDRFYLDKEEDIETAVKFLNDIIKFDGYQAERVGLTYKIISFDPDENVKTKKTKKPKGKGGRPPDPKLEEKKRRLNKEYYNLTKKNGFTKSKTMDILEKKYSWTKSTIETYLK